MVIVLYSMINEGLPPRAAFFFVIANDRGQIIFYHEVKLVIIVNRTAQWTNPSNFNSVGRDLNEQWRFRSARHSESFEEKFQK